MGTLSVLVTFLGLVYSRPSIPEAEGITTKPPPPTATATATESTSAQATPSSEDVFEESTLTFPPIVLISTEHRSQASRELELIFEWSEDVLSHANKRHNFGPEDLDLSDERGNLLAFDQIVQAPVTKSRRNSGYYGQAVARVPPMTTSDTFRFIGTLTVAKDVQSVQVFVPEGSVCSPTTGLCNANSNLVTVQIVDSSTPGVVVSSSYFPETTEPVIPLTFDFATEVAGASFTADDVVVYAYNLGFETVTSIPSSAVVGGPKRFYATVDVPGGLLDHLEIFVRGETVDSDETKAAFTESNHMRLMLIKSLETAFSLDAKGVYEDTPQTRQWGARVFAPPPYALPSLRPGVGMGGVYSLGNVGARPLSFGMGMPAPMAGRVAALSPTAEPKAPGKGVLTKHLVDQAVTHDKLALNGVQAPNIADGQVTTVKVHRKAVDSIALGHRAVTESKLADNAITNARLGLGSVSSAKLADGAVAGANLVGEVSSRAMGRGAVQSAHLADGAVSTGKIPRGAVGSREIADHAVHSSKLQRDTISTNSLPDGIVTSRVLGPRSIGANEIGDITTNKIGTHGVRTHNLAPGAITGLKLAKEAMGSSDLAVGAVTTGKIPAGAVGRDQLSYGAVTGNKLAVGQLTTEHLLDGSVPISKIDARIIGRALEDGIITTEKIMGGEISMAALGEGAVTSIHIASGGVSVSDLVDGAVTKEKMALKSILRSHLGRGGIRGQQLANGAVTSSMLGDGSVTSLKLGDFAVDTTQLGDAAVTMSKLVGEEVVGTEQLEDGSVTTRKVADSAVNANNLQGQLNTPQLAPSTVTGDKIADGAITNAQLVDGAVHMEALGQAIITGDKIAPGAVQAADLADGGVHSHALGDGSVTAGKIGAGAVKGEQLANKAAQKAFIDDGAFTTDKIADGAVGAGHIEAGAIDNADRFVDGSVGVNKHTNPFADGAVTGNKLGDNVIGWDKLADDSVVAEWFGEEVSFTSAKISSEAVTGAKVADAAVTAGKIQDGSISYVQSMNAVQFKSLAMQGVITEGKLASNSITNPAFDLGSINAIKIADASIGGAHLSAGSVPASKLADAAVSGRAIGAMAVTNNKLPSQDVASAAKLQDAALSARHLEAGAVGTAKLASLLVGTLAVADGNVLPAHFADRVVTSSKIGGGLEGRHVVDGAVTAANLANGAILAENFADGAVPGPVLVAGSVAGDVVAVEAVTDAKIGLDAVGTDAFASKTITSTAFASDSVTNRKLAPGAVTDRSFADAAVGAGHIVADVIDTTAIGSVDVTGKIEDGAVTTTHVIDGAVDSAALADDVLPVVGPNYLEHHHIADGAVRDTALGDGAVTRAKLAADISDGRPLGPLGEAAVADKSVTAASGAVRDRTVTETDFQEGIFNTEHLTDGVVVLGKIGGGATAAAIVGYITDSKLADGGITAWALANGSIYDRKFAGQIVSTDKIMDLGVGADALGSTLVTPADLATGGKNFCEGCLDQRTLQYNTVGLINAKYKEEGLEGSIFAANAVSSAKLALGSVVGESWAPQAVSRDLREGSSSIPASKLSLDGALEEAMFQTSSVTTAELGGGAVMGVHLADKSVSGAHLGGRKLVLSTEQLADGGMGDGAFADGSFTAAKVNLPGSGGIGEGSIDSNKLKDGAVSDIKLAAGSVTTAKLSSSAVGTTQLAAGGLAGEVFSSLGGDAVGPAAVSGAAFTAGAIVDMEGMLVAAQIGLVGSQDVASEAVGLLHVALDTVDSNAIADGAVQTDKITNAAADAASVGAASITDASVGDGSILTDAILQRSILGGNIQDNAITINMFDSGVFEQIQGTLKQINDFLKNIETASPPLINGRCLKPEFKRQASMRTLSVEQAALGSALEQVQQTRTMAAHQEFCLEHGLGQAVKITNTVAQSGASTRAPAGLLLAGMAVFLVWL